MQPVVFVTPINLANTHDCLLLVHRLAAQHLFNLFIVMSGSLQFLACLDLNIILCLLMIIVIIAGRFLFGINQMFMHILLILLIMLTPNSACLSSVFRWITTLSSSTMPRLPSLLAEAFFFSPLALTHLLKMGKLSGCCAR